MKLFIFKNRYRGINIFLSFLAFIFTFFLISRISVYASDIISPLPGYKSNTPFYYEQHSSPVTESYECFTLSGATGNVTITSSTSTSPYNWLLISQATQGSTGKQSQILGSNFPTGYSFCAVLNKNISSNIPSGTYTGTISGGGASITLSLIVYSSWVQVNNGGNTYSKGGYNLDNQSSFSNGFVFSGNSNSQFLKPPTNIGNNIAFMLDNPIIYNFNFFTTLFCTNIPNGCNSGNNLYNDGSIQLSSISNTKPISCGNYINWYYYNSDVSQFPSNICNNSIVLVNGYVNISNNINQSNVLIIANGNIVVDSGVNNLNAFLMSMNQIVILN
jgi:hypothetical protein